MEPSLDWLDLDNDEELIWADTPRIQTLYSVGAFAVAVTIAPAIVIGWEASLAGLLVGILVSAFSYYHLKNTEFVVTTKHAYSKRGIYGRSVTKIALKNIQDTSFNQNLLGRHFDYGTLFFSTAGGSGHELSFKHIDDPQTVQTKLNDHRRKLHTQRTDDTTTQQATGPAALFEELTDEMRQIRAVVDDINTDFDGTDSDQSGGD
jgi:uncharacterized membrane protein YdbT with pleckstrin-like domain